MAINTIKATIQMRHGNEENFDPDKMTAGEWAVSTDTKYVRMCFAPGIVLRMATYEAFEEDMKQIQIILATCQDIQTAVEEFNRLSAQHENNAKTYASQANASKTAAENSASAAKASETNAKTSETNAKSFKEAAAASESTASAKAAAASNSATAAKASETNAKTSETNASNSKKAAADAAANAADSAATAENKANAASQSSKAASDSALLSESWAVGNTGTREGEDTNNSKYWSEMAQRVVEAASEGGIIPIGTITFANLPTSGMKTGYMYNISNAFASDTRFEDGGNIYYAPGANVYYTAGGKWDVLTGAQVTGVKGNAESSYRKGNVNLTPANIGAVPATRKINNKALSADITLTAKDVGAVSESDKVNTGYGTCSTAADVAEKEVVLEDNPNWELKTGSEVVVKFSYTNTAQNPTLNVNGIGAKNIIFSTAVVTTSNLPSAGYANLYIRYFYNGTQYVFMGWSTDSNTTYGDVTTSTHGLMTAADKKKLDGIAEGANKTTLINNFFTTEPGLGAADAKTAADLYSQNMSLVNSVDALSASLTTYSSEEYIPNDLFDKITFIKKGSVVLAQFGRFNRAIDSTEGTIIIGTIPTQFRPKIATNFLILTTLHGITMYVVFNTSGNIGVRITGVVAENTNSYSSVMYIC